MRPRAIPKPISLERRFVIMQAGTVALALWLVASLLFLDLEFQRHLTASLRELQTALALNSELHSADDDLILAFWQAYSSREPRLQQTFDKDFRLAQDLIQRYIGLRSVTGQQPDIDALVKHEAELLDQTSRLLADDRNAERDGAGLRKVQQLDRLTKSTLAQLAQSELTRLKNSTVELHRFTQAFYALLFGCGLFSVVALLLFRHAHRRHLWQPLEQLQQMVLAVQHGNLNVSGCIPPNIEFGKLFQAFIEMAQELREMRDSLEHRVAERSAKLETAQKELLQAAKLASLGQLVSGVAHEINNPLTSILGFSEILLARSELVPSLRPQVQTIRDESLRLKNVVANLSSFARRAPQRLKKTDLRTVLDRLLELRHYQLRANNIEVSYERPTRPVWVRGDPDQLLQVVLNLVLNAEQAVMAYREHGNIRLACGCQDGSAWMSVRDDGGGMAPEVSEHLFEPFFTTKAVGLGTGLGLSISHGIIRQHQGTLQIQSALAQGTTVRIILPIEVEAASAATPSPNLVGARDEDVKLPRRVLVVDDEFAVGEMLKQVLTQHGCCVTCLQNSAAVEATIRNNEFDLIICDLKMPGLDGLQVLRLLRKSHRKLARRFLLMTGNLADADKHEIELVAVPLLQKPFTMTQLLQAIRGFECAPD